MIIHVVQNFWNKVVIFNIIFKGLIFISKYDIKNTKSFFRTELWINFLYKILKKVGFWLMWTVKKIHQKH